MLGMAGMGRLKLEMNKSSRELDQSLVVGIVRSLASLPEPEMLQHIMSLVVVPRVEALKVPEVVGIEPPITRRCVESPDKFLDTVRFFHTGSFPS